MEQKIQEIIEENGAKNTGKLHIFDNTLVFSVKLIISVAGFDRFIWNNETF